MFLKYENILSVIDDFDRTNRKKIDQRCLYKCYPNNFKNK